MKIKTQDSTGDLTLWLSAADTRRWATRPGASRPCSVLSGRRLFVRFDNRGDLVDIAIDSGRGPQDCGADELNAITTDHVATRYPNHPALRGDPQPIVSICEPCGG